MRQLMYWVVDRRCCDGCRLKTVDVKDTEDALRKMRTDAVRGRIIEQYDVIITSGYYWHDLKRLLINYDIEWEMI